MAEGKMNFNEIERNKSKDYFESYGDLSVHKVMLDDSARTNAYKEAIFSNKEYFKDKIVMDVGCGTGILSIFCAQAGAKKVYAVEASNVAGLAKDIVKENKFLKVIEVIHNRVEDVFLPDDIKVDVIISEWMGFYLLHEGMLDSIIVARERFLKEDGKMFPEMANMFVAPCSINFLFDRWDDVYGVKMSAFGAKLRAQNGNHPTVDVLHEDQLMGKAEHFASFNLMKVQHDNLNSVIRRKTIPASSNGNYQGLCLWWSVAFPKLFDDVPRVILDTSPFSPETHWKQTLLVLPYSMQVEEGEPLSYQLALYRRHTDSRHYYIELDTLDPDETEHPIPCNCFKTKCMLAKAFLHQTESRSDAKGDTESGLEDDNTSDDEVDEM